MNSTTAKRFLEVMYKNSRMLKDEMRYTSDIAHLSIQQIQTLSFLRQKENAQMSEIAEYFHIELPSATSLLNKLVALQLVKRQADEKDRRMVRIVLTDAGRDMLKKAMEEKVTHIEHMLSFLTESEQQELLRLLEKLNERIEKKA